MSVLVRVSGLSGPGGPLEDRGAAEAGADRRAAVGGVPAASGAVDGCDRRASSGGFVLQRWLMRTVGSRLRFPPPAGSNRSCLSTLVDQRFGPGGRGQIAGRRRRNR